MNNQLYRIVYCSRNRLRGTEADTTVELHAILAAARANNSVAGVTGALLYNSGNFAQVLEGPLEAVGRIFEKIQRDVRHGEVTVVQNGFVHERQFPDWSMAFAGRISTNVTPLTSAAFEAAFSHSVGAGEEILAILRDLVVQEDDWVLSEAMSC